MTLNYRTSAIADQSTYNVKRLYAIQWLEEGGKFSLAPYADSVGLITIGVGFNLQAGKPRAAVFSELGITTAGLTAKLKAHYLTAKITQTDAEVSATVKEWLGELNSYLNSKHSGRSDANVQSDLNDIMASYIPGSTFGFGSDEQVKRVFHGVDGNGGLVLDYEKQVDKYFPNAPRSPERLAFLSIAYNGLLAYMKNFVKSVAAGDRAEAWFDLRYGANGGKSKSDGIAKRRFIEAELFNLYDNPGLAVPADEAKKVYAMYTSHRTAILAYEQQYGVPPDGSSSHRNTIALANAPALAAIAVVPTLGKNLKPAADGFITWANTLLPSTATKLVSANFNPAAIMYKASASRLDALPLDGKGAGMENNLLVGAVGKNVMLAGAGNDVLIGRDSADWLDGGAGNDLLFGAGGADILTGGKGDDTLLGGLGNDLYRWLPGDGNDKIIEQREAGGQIDGRIVFKMSEVLDIAASGTFVETGAGTNVYKSPDGRLTLTGGATWQLSAPDGSVLVIGDEAGTFKSGDFGIVLKSGKGAAPTAAAGAGKRLSLKSIMMSTGQVSAAEGWIPQNTIQGDRADDHIHYDQWGNPTGPASPGSNDRLTGSEFNDKLIGLGGSDVIYGSDGDDLVFGASESSLDDAIAKGLATNGSGMRGDWLAGGVGSDTLIGDTGNDALFGGTGSDTLVGGAGDDYLNGDDSYVATTFDWTIAAAGTGNKFDASSGPALNYNPEVRNGDADVLYGGSGADLMSGGFGNDILFGDVGNDTMSGGKWDPLESTCRHASLSIL